MLKPKEMKDLKAIALDTGGTMTDTFAVDEVGSFKVGKAVTTPEDESKGILNSIGDALSQWKTTIEESGPTVDALVYSGTAMVNRLLEKRRKQQHRSYR